MFRLALRTVFLAVVSLVVAGLCFGQTGAFTGKVIGEDGKPIIGAQIKIERKDMKGNYNVKTNKKGEYFYMGIPGGQAPRYKISVEVNGQVIDSIDNVPCPMGEPADHSFDLRQQAAKKAQMEKAAQTGQLSADLARDMTPAQKEAMEKAVKERAAALQKNKALNDAFNVAMAALTAKDYPAAVEGFKKAAELDPKQPVIFANMAESYGGIAKAATGAEKDKALQDAVDAYTKALELKPDDAGMHNNLALTYANMKKIAECKSELEKAAALDPAGAGRYYFNMGAILTNTGQSDAALEAFKTAIDKDPNYADAYYQYAVALSGRMKTTADGKVIPPDGMKEALEKYLALRPDGANAEGAKGLLSLLGGSIQTQYVNPDAKKAAPPKKK
jgi:tetratricopeptide (TPR) repeat protein